MKRVAIDAAKPIDVTVAGRSPHVVAYRIWTRPPAGTWRKAAEGQTGDASPNTHAVGPVPAGGGLAVWMGLGGRPHTRYRVFVTLGQDGRVVQTGTIVLEGETNGQGVAQAEEKVELV